MRFMQARRKISILGSTGSIGTQAIDVICRLPERFEAYCLVAGHNAELLAEQCHRLRPAYAAIADESMYPRLKELCEGLPTELSCGPGAIKSLAALPEADLVVAAMVGYAGLEPAISALNAGKDLALANKESLVVAGELVTELCRKNSTRIMPVDSEHSAIFQCLRGNEGSEVEKLLLTASGGPFRTFTAEQLAGVTKDDALRHPKWKMGAKITIDSATMMNKGFEIIEARWLFGIPYRDIEVLVHPQSIVHSMVQYADGAVIAQLGAPDMRIPIQYALCYPDRPRSGYPRLDLAAAGRLDFEKPDPVKFPCLRLAYEALGRGGNAPCVLNAANEAAVAAFLGERIGFTRISGIIEETLARAAFLPSPSYDDYVESDREARAIASSLL